MLTLGEAAKAVGKSKPAIHAALKSGKLSGVKSGTVWQIDPAELFRVWEPVEVATDTAKVVNTDLTVHESKDFASIERLYERHIERLERENERLRQEAKDWKDQATRLLEFKAPEKKGFFARLFG